MKECLASHTPIALDAGGIGVKKFIPQDPPFFDSLKSLSLRILIDEVKRRDDAVSVGKEHIDPEHVSNQRTLACSVTFIFTE